MTKDGIMNHKSFTYFIELYTDEALETSKVKEAIEQALKTCFVLETNLNVSECLESSSEEEKD